MALTETPICNFGEKAKDFILPSTKNNKVSLKDCKGKNGTLVMFICNHCPYVKAVISDIVRDCENGDYVVAFVTGQKGLHPNHNKSKCRWRCLELIK